jgi:hypothetical protein
MNILTIRVLNICEAAQLFQTRINSNKTHPHSSDYLTHELFCKNHFPRNLGTMVCRPATHSR